MAVSISVGKREQKLLVLVGTAILFAVIVPMLLGDYALSYLEQQRASRANVEARIRQLQQDLGSIEEKRTQIRRYVNEYQDLMSRGVFDPPDTVSLVKEMRQIRTKRRQSAIEYNFPGGANFAPEQLSITDGSSIRVQVHPMVLNMKMLHDLDLFMFMESLRGSVTTFSFPVRCSFKLLETNFAIQNRENFDGLCQINWYSIEDPDANSEADEVNEEVAFVSE